MYLLYVPRNQYIFKFGDCYCRIALSALAAFAILGGHMLYALNPESHVHCCNAAVDKPQPDEFFNGFAYG